MDSNLIIKKFDSKLKLKDQKKLLDYLKKINNLEWPEFVKTYKKKL